MEFPHVRMVSCSINKNNFALHHTDLDRFHSSQWSSEGSSVWVWAKYFHPALQVPTGSTRPTEWVWLSSWWPGLLLTLSSSLTTILAGNGWFIWLIRLYPALSPLITVKDIAGHHSPHNSLHSLCSDRGVQPPLQQRPNLQRQSALLLQVAGDWGQSGQCPVFQALLGPAKHGLHRGTLHHAHLLDSTPPVSQCLIKSLPGSCSRIVVKYHMQGGAWAQTLNFFLHGFNTVSYLIDIFITARPTRIHHFYFAIIFGTPLPFNLEPSSYLIV